MNINIILKKALINKTGRSNSSIYIDIQTGLMTPPIKLGIRRVGWPEHEIDAILVARIQGKNEDFIRDLVSTLINERKTLANKVGIE
jgi:prophage regulatory protein